VENHHWAPQSLFPDAHRWPQSWLCRKCHNRWHQLVTPWLIPEKFRTADAKTRPVDIG
jgi:hypothetical protein